MKKIVKSSLLVMIMAIILFALTGCGQDKIIATKSTSAEDNFLGVSYEEKMEITFKKDKVDKITMTVECEDEDAAKGMTGLYTMEFSQYDDTEVKQDGKKVIMNIGAKAFSDEMDLGEDKMTKEEITKALEDEDYTIK